MHELKLFFRFNSFRNKMKRDLSVYEMSSNDCIPSDVRESLPLCYLVFLFPNISTWEFEVCYNNNNLII